MANNGSLSDSTNTISLDSVRDSLIRQEDTIVFSLIERAKFPMNSRIYDQTLGLVPGFSGSLVQYIVNETEAIQAKGGRYENPEEKPFFCKDPSPSTKLFNNDQSQFLHPAANSINVNKIIWDMYFDKLLPLFVADGDDSNYSSTASSDLNFLQALSRRIHFGLFVAEVKFRDAPQDYEPAIRAQDGNALMELLTFKSVEEMVKRRVEKKAMIFGQEVSLDDRSSISNKIDPSIVPRLYEEWVMPFTKLVQVEYLLRRLD